MSGRSKWYEGSSGYYWSSSKIDDNTEYGVVFSKQEGSYVKRFGRKPEAYFLHLFTDE